VSFLSASSFDCFVAARNYFLLDGYPCTVGHHHVQLLDEVSAVKRQINRINVLLPLLCENWRIPPYVVSINGEAAVFVIQESDLLENVRVFPHDRFAALVSAAEQIAEMAVNPQRSDDLYRAPERDASTIDSLLSEAQVSEEIIRDILPALTLNSEDEVRILLRDHSGTVRPIVLPPTETVRKPALSTSKKDGFWARVTDHLSVFNYVVTEEGLLVDIGDRDLSAFEKGKVYFFNEVSQRTTFSKQVRHVECDMKPQGEIFLPE
jgi:hypothetical protein